MTETNLLYPLSNILSLDIICILQNRYLQLIKLINDYLNLSKS